MEEFLFTKIYKDSKGEILEFIDKADEESKIDKSLIFDVNWSGVESCKGVVAKDKDRIIAFLGLIFSDRIINGQQRLFVNLTSLVIDKEYRGKGITSKIIQYVKSIGDNTLTAITPIPTLYNMYERNGFYKLEDYHIILKCNRGGKVKDDFGICEAYSKVITDVEFKLITENHQGKDSKVILAEVSNQQILLVLKKRIVQKRKFIISKGINYLDFFSRKLIRYSFLSKEVELYELVYISDLNLFNSNLSSMLNQICKFLKIRLFSTRSEYIETVNLGSIEHWKYYHSRQLYFSNYLKSKEYDILFSEMFLLDLN